MNLDPSWLVNPGPARGDQRVSRTTAAGSKEHAMPTASTTTSAKSPRLMSVVAMLWRTLRRDLTDPYRPELHYMRGPGPKWRAKHGMSEPGETRDFADSAAIAA